jgi:prevent-host-death family protein
MEQIGVRELRQNASKYLDRVKKGETFEVTDRGEPIAMLSPPPVQTPIERLVVEGALVSAGNPGALAEWLRRNPPVKLPEGVPSLSEVLQAMRDEDPR